MGIKLGRNICFTVNKTLFLIIAMVGSSDCFSQNQLYKNPKDIVRIIREDSVIEVGLIKADSKIRIIKDANYFWYDVDTILNTIEGFNGKLLHGKYTVTNKYKNLSEEGFFKHGLKSGNWRRWYPNGLLKERSKFRSGVLHGIYSFYDANGRVIKEGEYHKGKFFGKEFIYNIDGSIDKKNITKIKKNRTSKWNRIFRKKRKIKSPDVPNN